MGRQFCIIDNGHNNSVHRWSTHSNNCMTGWCWLVAVVLMMSIVYESQNEVAVVVAAKMKRSKTKNVINDEFIIQCETNLRQFTVHQVSKNHICN